MKDSEDLIIECDSVAVSDPYLPEVSSSALIPSPLIEIAIVLGGEGVCRILNETLECKSGTLLIFDRNVPHGYFTERSDQQLRILKIGFDPDIFTSLGASHSHLIDRLLKNGLPYVCSLLNSSAMGEICRICGAIRREIVDKKADWTVAAQSQLSLLLITVARYFDLDDTANIEHPKEWRIVFDAINRISVCFNNVSLTEEAVAEHLYISRSTLSRAFSSVTGESFREYLKSVRLREACRLLASTSMSNSEIAYACGMRDVQSFYNAFRKKYGVTPFRYKNMIKNSLIYKGENRIMVTINEINENVQKGKAKAVKELCEQAIAEGASAEAILQDGLIAAMQVIGEKFKNNQIFVPQVLVAARAMNTAIEVLRPVLGDGTLTVKGKVCIGTVRGDLHDIGKNLVKTMMESRGLQVIDLGTDVAPEAFIKTAIEEECGIICCSALLTTTMPVMAEVVQAAEAAGIRNKVKILVGGAPVTEEFCNKIGADHYSVDAASAADLAVRICAEA